MVWKDKKCNDLECENCPLDALHCITSYERNNNLKDVLQETNKIYNIPKQVYEAYEKELEKEYEL